MAANWTVLNQRQVPSMQPGGVFKNMWEVTVQASNGDHFTVTVPPEQHNADTMKEIINKEYARIMGVRNLQG